ncbi:polysaccharide export protein [Sphingomonas naphthae]|uniref:Polysaccharide export protein n=1 Tax=Sphingomonas naphthae TaxID=1813468 RepID=A0ABY7TLJ9_9SPHN|nr:polysaccharide biosynthesis/export family protein [Sphingomonas naphthae]WCT74117.1 polysaccharide export protein [Sphingomonas naphthae]
MILPFLSVLAVAGSIVSPVLAADMAPPTATTTTTGDAAAYRLGSGDKVRLSVYNDDTLSGEYEVDGSGNLALKLIGAVPAQGRTLPELTAEITTKLRDGYMRDPSVAVEVLNYRPFYVLGEVKEPGKYAFVSGMTVLNAVALAGGYTYRGRKDAVMVIRASDPAKKEQSALPSDAVMPGDIIRVRERFF